MLLDEKRVKQAIQASASRFTRCPGRPFPMAEDFGHGLVS